MHILVFHQYYLSSGQPGGSRFNEFARLWSQAGHKVTVIAGSLNYATGETSVSGKLYQKEQDGQVEVYRGFVPKIYMKGYLGRTIGYMTHMWTSMLASLKVDNPDIIIATSPPLTIAFPSLLYSFVKRGKIPLIFEVRDLWPESAITTGVIKEQSLVARSLYLLEKAAYRFASHINVLTPAFKENILERGLADKTNISVIPNGADIDLFKPGKKHNHIRKRYGWGNKFVVLYAGVHGRANRISQLLDVAQRLTKQKDIFIATIGAGPDLQFLQEKAEQLNLKNIHFYGAVSKEQVVDYINASDVCTAVLLDNPTFKTIYPNKVFDYMACKKPIIIAIDGIARDLVCNQAQAGLFAQPEDTDSYLNAIMQYKSDVTLRRKHGNNGYVWVLENATRQSFSEKYLQVMEELVSTK